jgi:hypothetical protein
MHEREIKRYAAYFRGWCQAFGDHESVHGDASGIDWLIADHQVGLVMPRSSLKQLYRDVLRQEHVPTLSIGRAGFRIGSLEFVLDEGDEQRALEAIERLVAGEDQVHVFLTSHLLYGSGNRIITFSTRKPLAIIYKEIGSMRVARS